MPSKSICSHCYVEALLTFGVILILGQGCRGRQKLRLCCKNEEEKKLSVSGPSNLFLRNQSKQCGDQSALPSDVSFCRFLHLPFAYHVHDLEALQCSPRCLKRKEAHARFRQTFDQTIGQTRDGFLFDQDGM